MLLRALERWAEWLTNRFTAVLVVAIPVVIVVYLFCGEVGRFLTYVIGGAAAIWLTNRRATAMEDNVALAQKGQAVARFESAVKLLESDNSAIIVGAVYALNRMAKEEAEYRAPVFDVLCELIREDGEDHSVSARKIAVRLVFEKASEDGSKTYPFRGRLMQAKLSGWDLSGLDFSGANLEGADLNHANVRDSILKGSNLVRASIYGLEVNSKTNMQGIVLRGVEVSSTDFNGIDLSGADLRPGGGSITRFGHVNFIDCDFRGARLDGTKFRSVRFKGCKNLTEEQLLRAGALVSVEGLEEGMELAVRQEKPELFVSETEE